VGAVVVVAEVIAALYVQTGGCYFGLPDVDPWDEAQGVFRSPFYDRCALVDNATPQEIDQ